MKTKFICRATLFVAVTVLAVPVAHGATTIWMDGVSESSGWVDYNKSWDGDSNLCWAAAASNIIDWWQTRAVSAGLALPDGTPTSGNIFSAFKETVSNEAGNTVYGWEWYFSGSTSYTGGAYWKDYVDSLNLPANDSLPGYIKYDFAYDWYNGAATYENLISTLTTIFEEGGGISLGIAVEGASIGHAITLWGFEYDGDTISKIYITDSDDSSTNGLVACSIGLKTETATDPFGSTTYDYTKMYLTDYINGNYNYNYYIDSWSALTLAIIPEPSAFGLLAGIGALALAVSRRRRSRK